MFAPISSEEFELISLTCQNSQVGKLLPNALYVHNCALTELDELLQNYENVASQVTRKSKGATLVKFSLDKPRISYLFYPDFDTDPHPQLYTSVIIDTSNFAVGFRDYTGVENPPILHRKETFVSRNYPLYEQFAELTRLEIALGLLDNSRFIGTRQDWEQRLSRQGIDFEGHRLICPIDPHSPNKRLIRIERHKAAIQRKELSRPVRLAVEAGLFTSDVSFFDYGCGYGGDVERIAQRSIKATGWDPYYCADLPLISADIVNVGYVINVVEDLAERREALLKAWELTRQVLIVAAQVLIDDRNRGVMVYGDGIITSRNTFQKYYDQDELKIYIDQVLDVDAIPAGLGIYFVFRDVVQKETFRASRFHSRVTTPRIQAQIKRFEDYQDMLAPLMAFVTERGRLPLKGELPQEQDIKAEFHSFRHAFNVVLQATDPQEWEAIAEKRRQELLLYLALSNFTERPSVRKLSLQVREDLKALFGSYKQACLLADLMLFSLNDLDKVRDVCYESPLGQKHRHSFWVHLSVLELLDPLLRLYEGCASRTVGRLEGANVVKFSTKEPKISYLCYPNFDTEAHPILQTSMQIDLQDLRVSYRDYDFHPNPPILHQKEMLLTPDHPHYEKFSRLTKQEKDWGLLADYSAISHLRGWLKCLEEHCATVINHRVYWHKDADPYQVKIVKSAISARKRKLKNGSSGIIEQNISPDTIEQETGNI